jgi:hypothetical protein
VSEHSTLETNGVEPEAAPVAEAAPEAFKTLLRFSNGSVSRPATSTRCFKMLSLVQ